MSRIDTINNALSSHLFINLNHRQTDEAYRNQFSKLTDAEQQQLIRLATPSPEGYQQLPESFRNDVEAVARCYAFRMIDNAHLPLFLRKATLLAHDSDSADVLFLSALTATSAALKGIEGTYRKECVMPNLYLFITGAAASGKGRANLCHRLLEPIDVEQRIFIPGNSSATAMNEALAENGGQGIIFETEADTLSRAFKLGGNYNGDLRKAFQNEKLSYRRRTNHEEVVIPDPYLSLVLTGTPSQIPAMFQSAENGLFSRFLFYRLDPVSEDVLESEDDGITGRMVSNYYLALGMELRDLYHRLQELRKPLPFALTAEQQETFYGCFQNITTAYKNLALLAYQSHEASAQLESTCHRMGNICYRLLMVLSALRLIQQPQLPQTLTCHPHDFNNMVIWQELLMHHSLIHYDEMLVATGMISDDEEEPDFNSPDMLNANQGEYWRALPQYFIKKDALLVAQKLNLSVRTVERYLAMYSNLGILKVVGKGCYKKN